MKLAHIADLHLGKRLYNYSLRSDQLFILKRILEILDTEKPDALLIAGDVYDKAIPSAEAVTMLDDFLNALKARELPVFLISGNHDSPERMAFGAKLMENSGIHIAPVYNGNILPIQLYDEYGPVSFYLMPFVKPIHVKTIFPEEEIHSYTDAMKTAINHMSVCPTERNVLIGHQFVTGAVTSESEEHAVGGLDHVDASVFEPFDYVALGHIHGPQNVGSERIRYCGTPLKYSFSEVKHEKSVTIVELGEKKGNLCDYSLRTVSLSPLRDMTEIRGAGKELLKEEFYQGRNREDYYRVILTDEEESVVVLNELRKIFPNIMRVEYDNARTRENRNLTMDEKEREKSPEELFSEFYENRNNTSMTKEMTTFLKKVMDEIWDKE